jgi:predicted HTH transcriptional regulator
LQILERAKEHGRVTISQIVQITEASRNTVKKHLQALVAMGHLDQQGIGKGTWYGRG